MTEPVTTWMLPPPEPYQGPSRCPACAGGKVTGEQYSFDPNPADTRKLVVDVFCPVCDGCGRDGHDECKPSDHADHPDDDWDDDDPHGDFNDGQVCFSCAGRRYWVCQGFTETVVRNLRVPCGCAEPLLVRVVSEARA